MTSIRVPPDTSLDDGRSVAQLASELAASRKALARLKEQIESTERLLIAGLGFDRPEGQQTYIVEQPNGDDLQVVMKQPVRHSLDESKFAALKKECSRSQLAKCFPVRHAVMAGQLREVLAEADATSPIAKLAAAAVTSKPGKVSVEVRL